MNDEAFIAEHGEFRPKTKRERRKEEKKSRKTKEPKPLQEDVSGILPHMAALFKEPKPQQEDVSGILPDMAALFEEKQISDDDLFWDTYDNLIPNPKNNSYEDCDSEEERMVSAEEELVSQDLPKD